MIKHSGYIPLKKLQRQLRTAYLKIIVIKESDSLISCTNRSPEHRVHNKLNVCVSVCVCVCVCVREREREREREGGGEGEIYIYVVQLDGRKNKSLQIQIGC